MLYKDELLQLQDMFIDNEYLDSYVELINSNADRKKQRGKTQSHHVVPRMVTRKLHVHDKENVRVVNLLYADHFLAHYYLAMCMKDDLRYKNVYSLNIIVAAVGFDLDTLLQQLDIVQTYYELQSETYSINNPMFNQQHLDYHNKRMRDKDVRDKISATMRQVRLATDDVIIHKGHEGKRVLKSDLADYLADGWELGSKQQHLIRIHKDGVGKSIFDDEWHEYELLGWQRGSLAKLSDDHIRALSESLYKQVLVYNRSDVLLASFKSVRDATKWWFDNQSTYPFIVPRETYNYKTIARLVKKSSDEHSFYGDIRFVYCKGG